MVIKENDTLKVSHRWTIKDNRKEKTLISKGSDIPQIKNNHLKSCDFFIFDSPPADVTLLLSFTTKCGGIRLRFFRPRL